MGSYTGGGNDQEKCNYNLPCGHAYTLIDIREVTTNDGETFRLFKIKNPWRSDAEFEGSFEDSSELWNLKVGNQTLA